MEGRTSHQVALILCYSSEAFILPPVSVRETLWWREVDQHGWFQQDSTSYDLSGHVRMTEGVLYNVSLQLRCPTDVFWNKLFDRHLPPNDSILFPRVESSPHLPGKKRRGRRMSHYNLASFAILVRTVILSHFKNLKRSLIFKFIMLTKETCLYYAHKSFIPPS